ncbi:MAG: hypothetical protein JSR12_04240 [Bacteroidetes bacterium]|nr:hypothetical protein [Bacteroidota bacterium]
MSNLSLLEKLNLQDERNLLIQGLPSSIEKQFAKLSYAKNVTPLLKTKKVDFALVFAVNQNQLMNVMKEVLPALHNNSKLWVAYPKETSKIVSDLNRDCSWDILTEKFYESIDMVALDHVWSAMRFKKNETENVSVEKKQTEKKVENKKDNFEKSLVTTVVVEEVLIKHVKTTSRRKKPVE